MSQFQHDATILTLLKTVGTVLSKFISIPCQIVVAGILGPAGLGIVKIFDVIHRYVSFNHLGLLQVLSRELPITISNGQQEEKANIERTVWSGNFIFMMVTIALFGILYGFGVNLNGILTKERLFILIGLLLFSRWNSYLHSSLKGYGAFRVITKKEVLLSVVRPVIAVLLVWIWGVNGALLGAMLHECLGVIVTGFLWKPTYPPFRLHFQSLKKYLKLGVQLFVLKATDGLIWIVDLTIISLMLTTTDVGLYSFALSALSHVTGMISIFGMMIFRDMLCSQGGLPKNDFSKFKKYFEKWHIAFLLCVCILLGEIYYGYDAIISSFLDQYRLSLPCLSILILGQLCFFGRLLAASFLNAISKLKYYVMLTLVVIGLNIGLDSLVISKGFGILGVAWASTLSMIILFFGFLCCAIKIVHPQTHEFIFYPLRILFCLGMVTLLLLGGHALVQNQILGMRGLTSQVIPQEIAIFVLSSMIFIPSCFILFHFFFQKANLVSHCKLLWTLLIARFTKSTK